MKTKILGLIAFLTLGCSGMVMAGTISVDHVDGVTAEGSGEWMATGQSITFHIRMESETDTINGITNGFRIYSPDGATWGSTTIDTTGVIGKANFDMLWLIGQRNVDGTGSDTVTASGATMMNPVAMPAGFSEITHTIAIGPIDAAHDDKQICIDSCWFPSGVWLWASPSAGSVIPEWGGPYCYQISADGTDVNRLGDMLPTEWSLGQNYPNPFNPTTEIAFDVPSRSHVTLAVYNVLGQHVTDLADEVFAPGRYTADWDGTSQSGSSVASGVYFYRLETENYIETKKMMLLK